MVLRTMWPRAYKTQVSIKDSYFLFHCAYFGRDCSKSKKKEGKSEKIQKLLPSTSFRASSERSPRKQKGKTSSPADLAAVRLRRVRRISDLASREPRGAPEPLARSNSDLPTGGGICRWLGRWRFCFRS